MPLPVKLIYNMIHSSNLQYTYYIPLSLHAVHVHGLQHYMKHQELGKPMQTKMHEYTTLFISQCVVVSDVTMCGPRHIVNFFVDSSNYCNENNYGN